MIVHGVQEARLSDLGLVDYLEALRVQQETVAEVTQGAPHALIACRHPHVLTVNRRCQTRNILASPSRLLELGLSVYCAHRGGEVTYHGPGQIVFYPIFDLNRLGRDLGTFVWKLEEAVIRVLRDDLGLNARRMEGQRGVWVGPYKVASIGLGVKRWVTFHGLALNISSEKKYFEAIRPCGSDVAVASINDFFDEPLRPQGIRDRVLDKFEEVFELRFTPHPEGHARHGVDEWPSGGIPPHGEKTEEKGPRGSTRREAHDQNLFA